jgi:hypothetical protein
MADEKPSQGARPCGKHVELAANPSARVTQCPCGTVYLTLIGQGVTVRMSEETLRATTAALISATDKVDETERPVIN